MNKNTRLAIISASICVLSLLLSFMLESLGVSAERPGLPVVISVCAFFVTIGFIIFALRDYLIKFSNNKIGPKMALTHVMAIISSLFGLFLFYILHWDNLSSVNLYNYYFIVFPICCYIMAALVIILRPIESFFEGSKD